MGRGRAGHGGRSIAAHRARRRQSARTGTPRRCGARHRNARTRWHFGAAAVARQEARLGRDHGVDADPPQRGDQLQGTVARRRRLHPEAGNYPRAAGRRYLQARSAAEDPVARWPGSPPRRARSCRAGDRARPASGSGAASRRGHADRCQPGCAGEALVRSDRAARSADRLVDRWAAGADVDGGGYRPGDRSFPRADHPAYAADLHDHSGRAPGARQPPSGA